METFHVGIPHGTFRSNLHHVAQLCHVSAASCAGLWWSCRACDQAHQGAQTPQGSCIESSQPSFMLFNLCMWVKLKDAKSKSNLKVGCSLVLYSHFEAIGVQSLRHSKVIRLLLRASHLQAVQQREWRCSGSAAAIGILC